MHLQSYSKGLIDVLVKEGIGEGIYFITSFYEHPKMEDKKAS